MSAEPVAVLAALLDHSESALDAAWAFLGTGLFHGTVLFALTAVIATPVLRRAGPAFMAALWTVVLVKFVIPVGPEVPVSMSALVSALMSSGESGEAVHAAASAGAALDAATQRTALDVLWLLLQFTLLGLWATVVITRSRAHLRRHRRHRLWAEELAHGDGRLEAAVRHAARAVGLSRIPAIRITDRIAAPELVGLVRPILVVPEFLLAGDSGRLDAVLLHELAHLRRRDPALRVIQLAVATLFFFWPVVTWINRRIDDHREMACDQWAVSLGELNAGDYARTLVALARRSCEMAQARSGGATSRLAAVALALIGLGPHDERAGTLSILPAPGKKQLESRVQCLMARRLRPRMGALSLAGLTLWSLVSLGGAGSAQAIDVAISDCTIEPGVVESILASFPEADADGDGSLSRDEVCAHQRRLKEQIVRGGEELAVSESVEFTSASAPSDRAFDRRIDLQDLEQLGCAACGECDDDSTTPSALDARICTADE